MPYCNYNEILDEKQKDFIKRMSQITSDRESRILFNEIYNMNISEHTWVKLRRSMGIYKKRGNHKFTQKQLIEGSPP